MTEKTNVNLTKNKEINSHNYHETYGFTLLHETYFELTPSNVTYCNTCGIKLLKGTNRLRHTFKRGGLYGISYYWCLTCGKQKLLDAKKEIDTLIGDR